MWHDICILICVKPIYLKNMDYNNELNFGSTMTRDCELSMSQAFPVLMRKVYVWMSLALAITGITAFGVANSPGVMSMIFSNQIVFWGLVIAELALVFAISGAINRLSLSTATMLFVLYSVINGVVLSSIFLVYTMTSAFIGYTTKTDLTSMGKILLMAIIGLIIASLVNVFLVKSSGFDLIISYAGVLIFVGLTAYDSQKIKQMLQMAPDASEASQKLALVGALSLYLDFINLFIYLLRILGKRE